MYAIADLGRTATVAVAAIALSTAALGLATAPARATAVPVSGWQASVNHSIDRTIRAPLGVDAGALHAVTVAVSFDADGKFADAAVKRSSGSAAVDAEALRTAKAIRYPVLPSADGTPRTVDMKLFFGAGADEAAAQVRRQQLALR